MPENRSTRSGADPSALAAHIAAQHVPEMVDTLNELRPEIASSVVACFPHERLVELFDSPQFEAAAELIQRLPIEQTSAVLRDMSADRAAHLLRKVDDLVRARLLSCVDHATENSLRQ